MWQHNYAPLAGSLPLSTLVAALPIFVLLFLLGVMRKSAWIAATSGLAAAAVVAVFEYGMPVRNLIGAVTYGGAYGLFPIGWIVFGAILMYRITVETGKFEVLKNSVGHLTTDRRVQALLIAFAFGAFIEGASGFGTPIAVAAAMLAGLGFSPFFAAGICLVANTAPVAFGSIGIPIITLAATTGLPLDRLSAGVGRICAPVSLFVPAYLVIVMGGWKALRGVLPAAAVCGIAFASVQFFVSNFIGVQLTDILASLTALGCLVILLRMWKPKDTFSFPDEHRGEVQTTVPHYTAGELVMAWSPYILLVIFVLLWGYKPFAAELNKVNVVFNWAWLHNEVQRVQPVVMKPTPYPAAFNLNYLSAAGTSCLFAGIVSAFVLRMGFKSFFKVLKDTVKQLFVAEMTMACVLAIAFLMNYSGATGTLGLAFAATGASFPFFSALLGWLGVFLTGSDTSANALFGPLQEVTATRLGMNPVLMAAANSSGGVMGKMISLASIAVASAATSMKREDEARLFRFTFRHSIFLASVIGIVVLFYAYVAPGLAP
ncbi:MAG TPA: L-lactate permease [Bryobacteraceae bacterium]|nr:L-lactate permease [Bryobacteraceae bacterium]